MNEDSVKLDFWIIYLYQTVYISSCLIVGHQEEPKQFLQSCSKPFSLPMKKNIFTGSIETVESCDGIKLSMEKEWGGAETWKGIRFVSNKRPEVGRPTIWFGKSQIVSSNILSWSCSLVCNWYQTNLKSIIWVLKKCKKCIFRGLKVILVLSFPRIKKLNTINCGT